MPIELIEDFGIESMTTAELFTNSRSIHAASLSITSLQVEGLGLKELADGTTIHTLSSKCVSSDTGIAIAA